MIEERLGIESVTTPGRIGQFDVLADGKKIVGRGGNWLTWIFGAGYPDLDDVVEELRKQRAG
jgi:hypothetical protein